MPNDVVVAIDGKTVEGWDLDSIKQLTVRACQAHAVSQS